MAAPTSRQAHVNTPLTNIAIAYRNENFVGPDFLYPRVTVAKISDLYWKFDKGE